MTPGTLFFVVGASGVGKDTLIAGAKAALAGDEHYVFARRTITRAADAGGEDHLAVSPEEFARIGAAGGFLVEWSAHHLQYGLTADLADALAKGRHVVANGSRAAIPVIAERVADLMVVEITALPATIAARLRQRGREAEPEIAARIARNIPLYPDSVKIARIANDADPESGIRALLELLRPERPY